MRMPIVAGIFAIVLSLIAATPAPAVPAGGAAVATAAATLDPVGLASHCRCLDSECRRIECRSPVIRGVPPGAADCQCVRSFFLLCTLQQCTSSTRSAGH